jgi:hypothetical protein
MGGGSIQGSGAFKGFTAGGSRSYGNLSSSFYDFFASRVVLTGPDVAGTNISVTYWRRVA